VKLKPTLSAIIFQKHIFVQNYIEFERDYLLDPGVDGRIILRWILRKCDERGMDWIELVQYKIGSGGGHF
jgi:hypothetical protein